MTTKIEWAMNPDGTKGEVWNPTTGCSKVSAGCKNCYAETIAHRFWGEREFTDVRLHEDRLAIPFHWRKPRRIFVDSMSDLFHEDIPDEFIEKVFKVIGWNGRHTFIVLTKRAKRMYEFVSRRRDSVFGDQTLPNLWLLVSIENQKAADERVPYLLKTHAAVMGVSCEPLLGSIDLRDSLGRYLVSSLGNWIENPNGGIDWVVVGGESGANARPMRYSWLIEIVDQCKDAKVPVFVKQDSGFLVPGKQGRIPDDIWALKEFPTCT